jgi:6-phosphogluconolactonase (cycloisomerase 2 family)
LDPTLTPEFTHTPGQIAFTPDGSQLVVTTKANGDHIDVFGVSLLGRPSLHPVVNTKPGSVPFAVAFDAGGHLVVAETGTGAVVTYTLHANGTITTIDTALTGQAATCWVTTDGVHFYASNAGSANVSGYTDEGDGTLTALGNTATDAGTVDATATADGRFLYVQAGAAGIIDGYRIAADGTLTPVGSVTVPHAVGAEGIAAS